MLTSVMYHYVRNLPQTRYPRIKALLTDHFIGQLDYLQKHYSIISLESCIETFENHSELPPNSCLLTFDDGVIDNFVTIFPLLSQRGITGAFFVPGKPILSGIVTDVHKIHFILSTNHDTAKLVKDVFSEIDKYRHQDIEETESEDGNLSFDLPSNAELYAQLGTQYMGYDSADVGFIKRSLQKGLPGKMRSAIIDFLFEKYVSEDEKAFSAELYMSIDQIKLMRQMGMYIGGHGYSHERLGILSPSEQREDIVRSLELLGEIYGGEVGNWAMSYPHGSRNEKTVDLLKDYGCSLAFINENSQSGNGGLDPLQLPRVDTIELPFSAVSTA
jgi:peptidoglycan/xylan/chitin deacetylase (PgdA/CDA1 family)